MDSTAESSSALTRRAEYAAAEGATHTAEADGPLPLPLNKTSATPHPPDEIRPSNNPKLDQMLQLFQRQLDLQQKQLDLLRRIAGTIDENEPANSKAVGKQADTSIQPDALGWDDWDPELVMKWQRLRGPESPHLWELGEDFLSYCEQHRLFWFSPKNKNIASLVRSNKKSKRGAMISVQEVTVAQILQYHWPPSLGTTDKEGMNWTFLTKASAASTRLTLEWYSYDDKGDLSKADSDRVCLSCTIYIYV
jgi:hypothetical protein